MLSEPKKLTLTDRREIERFLYMNLNSFGHHIPKNFMNEDLVTDMKQILTAVVNHAYQAADHDLDKIELHSEWLPHKFYVNLFLKVNLKKYILSFVYSAHEKIEDLVRKTVTGFNEINPVLLSDRKIKDQPLDPLTEKIMDHMFEKIDPKYKENVNLGKFQTNDLEDRQGFVCVARKHPYFFNLHTSMMISLFFQE